MSKFVVSSFVVDNNKNTSEQVCCLFVCLFVCLLWIIIRSEQVCA